MVKIGSTTGSFFLSCNGGAVNDDYRVWERFLLVTLRKHGSGN